MGFNISNPLNTHSTYIWFLIGLNPINILNQFCFSVRFNSHSPGVPGLASAYWSKGWWRWFFYRPDALPVAQPIASKHWRNNIRFHGLAYPKLTWGLPTLSLTINRSWLPWGRVAMPLISPLPVPQWWVLVYSLFFCLLRSCLTIQIMIKICTRSPIYLFCLYNLFNKYYANNIL